MTGKSYEIGLKGSYFEGALNASVALFDTLQENRAYLPANQATFCPGYPAQSCYSAAGPGPEEANRLQSKSQYF